MMNRTSRSTADDNGGERPGNIWGTTRRVFGSLSVVIAVALAGVGVSRAQAVTIPAPPVSCAAVVLDNGAVEITWSGGPDLLDIIRNGQTLSTVFLREDGARYIDDQPPGGVTTYEIAGRNRFGDPRAETRRCGTVQTEVQPELLPVASCTIGLTDYGNPDLDWSAATGAQSYVVWRNGQQILRVLTLDDGVTQVTTTTTFRSYVDHFPPTGRVHYSVSSQSPAGVTDRTYCGSVVIDDRTPPPVAERPPSCSVSNDGGGVVVTWGNTPNREVSIWRNGRVVLIQNERDGNRWFDASAPTGTVHYSVSGNAAGQVSAKRYCGSVEVSVAAQPSCQVTRNSGVFDVRWTGFETDEVVVRRSVDGSPWYWRGRSTGTSFDDSGRSGDIRYQVAPRTAGGQTGPATICTMS